MLQRQFIDDRRLDLLREVDALVRDRLDIAAVSQAFPVLVPYSAPDRVSVAIRAIVTNDYMTGRPAWPGRDVAADLLDDLAAEIRRRLRDVDLVMYDVTGKPPATVEWE
jgi:GMP synthase (glutamine-hydrolysing)